MKKVILILIFVFVCSTALAADYLIFKDKKTGEAIRMVEDLEKNYPNDNELIHMDVLVVENLTEAQRQELHDYLFLPKLIKNGTTFETDGKRVNKLDLNITSKRQRKTYAEIKNNIKNINTGTVISTR